MKSIFTILLMVFGLQMFTAQSQNAHRYCGHDQVLEKARAENPTFNEDYQAFLDQALNSDNLQRLNDTVYKVQVVFHILYNPNDPYQNVSDELIYSQLDALNRDYNMRNEDTSETRDIFKPIASSVRIEFELAKRRPNGTCANAIIRKPYNNSTPILPIFTDFLIKENGFGGSSAWNTKEYLNIWVVDLNNGRDPSEGFLGGFAYFPDMNPVKYNGVVLDFRFFGQDNPWIEDVQPGFARYSKGRACVHEVGHWFGMRHIWGDLGTLLPEQGCDADDGINDTPNAATAYPGLCADTIVNSCVDSPIDYPDMFENYMDYSSDDCQSMFTAEQASVMRLALQLYRPELVFEEVPNTTEVIAATIMENTSGTLCFDLGDCFGFSAMNAEFEGADSVYSSDLGSAVINSESNCISYTAGNFINGNEVDEFTLVVYDAHLMQYDTTRFVITIDQLCPTVSTIVVEAEANSTFQQCIDLDPCLDSEFSILTFCDNTPSLVTTDLIAGTSDQCVNFAVQDYNPSNTQITVCVITRYDDDAKDTTYIQLNISPSTSVDVFSSKENGFDVYPNPTKGQFAVNVKAPLKEDVQISIFNATGQLLDEMVMQKGQQSKPINITGYSKGIYLLLFETEGSISYEKINLE
jgi:hypothetical protein